ncbi:MAG: TIGR03564 family F420-dependent LLM class oxidoreductase [Pseudomonadales bacterium]|jgi:F420-dependent oxidoreductase-like protein
MRLGINGTGLVQRADVERVCAHAAAAAADGFSSYWLAEHPTGGFDALTVLAAVGQRVPDIELGTAIVPTFPRHPLVLAGQALTTAGIIGPRLTLGIGLSHEPMMAQLGIGFDKPIRHLREYLSILAPLVREGRVDYHGETLTAHAELFRVPEHPIPVVVAALGPQALGVAGRLADGTTLAWVGPKTVREHIVPRLSESASKADRPEPRVIATLPVCVTDDGAAVRAAIGDGLKMYGQLPSYRAMFDREGVDGPADVAIVGSAEAVRDGIAEMRAAGVTDFAASEFYLNPTERDATRNLLKSLASGF